MIYNFHYDTIFKVMDLQNTLRIQNIRRHDAGSWKMSPDFFGLEKMSAFTALKSFGFWLEVEDKLSPIETK